MYSVYDPRIRVLALRCIDRYIARPYLFADRFFSYAE
jgi:hypothetical protein